MDVFGTFWGRFVDGLRTLYGRRQGVVTATFRGGDSRDVTAGGASVTDSWYPGRGGRLSDNCGHNNTEIEILHFPSYLKDPSSLFA